MKKTETTLETSSELDSDISALGVFIGNITQKHHTSHQNIINLLNKKRSKQSVVLVPSSIFRNKSLGIMESITKYLKEDLNLRYHEIAVLLDRDDRLIWVTYNKAKKKVKDRFVVKEPNLWMPISIFRNRMLGPLEVSALYLKKELGLSFSEIGDLLNRDSKTIWSCYNKAVKKEERKEV